MLTRRSRKEAATSPNAVDKPAKTKKSTTPRRSKSKSIDRSVRARSRSSLSKRQVPKVILERFDKKVEEKLKKDTKRKKSVEPNDSIIMGLRSRKSPTPVKEKIDRSSPFVDKISNDKVSTLKSSLLINDDESDDEPQSAYNTRIKTPPKEFGGLFGNIILAITFPIIIILSKIALKTKGILIPFPRGYLRLVNYYDQDVFIWSAIIVGIQFFISLIPLAKKTVGLQNDDSKSYYRFSGFMNLIIGASIVGLMEYYNYQIYFILEVVNKRVVPHIVVSVLFALFISIVLFVAAKMTKQTNKSDSLNFFQKFFIGTIYNPTLGQINLKLTLYRYSTLMTILCNYLVIMNSLKTPVNIYLYVVTGLQILYSIDKLIFEYNLLSSFYLQKEKVGYWTIIQHFLQPSINFLPIQILLVKNISVNYIVLSIVSILFLLGYICQRYSDITRYRYETSSTFKRSYSGLRFTEHGLWSFIRYPNYMGAIIVHLALILPVIELNLESVQASWPVFIYPLYYIITLSHRCVRVSNEGQSQYNYMWDHKYATKWNLIPKIY